MKALIRGALLGALGIAAAACGQIDESYTTRGSALSFEADWACPSCGKLSNIDGQSLLGDLEVDAISAFGSWSGGYVNLICDDGSVSDSITLDIAPVDLASGVDLLEIAVPDVGYESNPDCWLDVVSTSQQETVEVVIEE